MRLNLSSKTVLWLIWFVFTPLAFVSLYLTDPPRNITIPSLATVAVVYLITVFFSFKVGATDIILLQGIGLAAFLMFGLFVQALLTEFAITTFLMTQKLTQKDAYRIPFNMLMFLGMSISEGTVYYLLGGDSSAKLTHFMLNNVIPIIGFYVSSYTANEILIYYGRRLLFSKTAKMSKPFEKDSIWEILATIMMMPLGIAFYTLYILRGISGMFLIAIPMVALSIVLRQFNASQQMADYLQRVNTLGQKLTEALSVEDVIKSLIADIPLMLNADYGYVVLYDNPDKPHLICHYRKDNDNLFVPYQREADVSFDVYNNGRAVTGYGKKEMFPYLKALSQNNARSFLAVPMIYQGRIIGVLTVGTYKKIRYAKTHRLGLEIVGNFLAVALRNARSFERTKNETMHCPLTGLYNYRYLISRLNRLFEAKKVPIVSLIMFDIDNFKQINDHYGHQNGNDVLVGVAERLKRIVGDHGAAVRYGGEEFTIILPNMSIENCRHLAERIRRSIAENPFIIYLDQQHCYEKINVTISVGTATAPEAASEPLQLIRNADHAMYHGAKQMGKNRVAHYC